MNPKVDFFFNRAEKWQDEYKRLRKIILDCGLIEELKWGHPCYSLEKKNVVLIHGFKEYCAILFIKGALLKDPEGILIQQTENVQAGRQVREGSGVIRRRHHLRLGLIDTAGHRVLPREDAVAIGVHVGVGHDEVTRVS